MNKLSKKSALLFAAVLSVCALGVPTIASAASWGVIGTTHTLTYPKLSVTVPAVGYGWDCTDGNLHAVVRNAATLTITAASSTKDCHGTGTAVNCTVTYKATNLDWNETGITTSNVTIDRVHWDFFLENRPDDPFDCVVPGHVTVTGNMVGGLWDAAAHQVTYASAMGLSAHVPGLGSFGAATTTTIRDATQTLTLT